MIIIYIFFVEIVIFVPSKCTIGKTLQPLLQRLRYSCHGKIIFDDTASLIYLKYFFIHAIMKH